MADAQITNSETELHVGRGLRWVFKASGFQKWIPSSTIMSAKTYTLNNEISMPAIGGRDPVQVPVTSVVAHCARLQRLVDGVVAPMKTETRLHRLSDWL